MSNKDYLKRIVEKAPKNGVDLGLTHAVVAHDDDCRIWEGKECSCTPDIVLVPDGPQG